MERIQNKVAWALVVALSLLVIAAVAGVAQGGPLDPTAPPGSTGKNVITVLPFTINQPGSYVLNGNLTGVSGDSGILVEAANVTIDLQGFELVGVPGAQAAITSSEPGLNVRNGTIRAWPANAIEGASDGSVVQDVSITGNGGGIVLTGRTDVRNCLVELSSGVGINLAGESSVSNCRVWSNGGNGISVGPNSTITDTVASSNGGNGVSVGLNSTITDTAASSNGGVEILAGTGASLENCVADGGGTGGNGIQVGPDSVVRGCTARNNGEDAEIMALDGSLIEDCVVDGWNGTEAGPGFGIWVKFDSVVRGCTVRYNDYTGIVVEGWRNRIEGNQVVNNFLGIDVTGAFKNVGIANNTADNVFKDWQINTTGDNRFYPVFPAGNAPIGAWDNLDQ